MINLRCKVAWDVPSLKFPKSSSSSSDEEFPCEEVEGEVEVECQDESKTSSEDELQGGTNLDTETGHQEENEGKIDGISCDDDQISYSDIIFSIPIQRKSGDGKDPPDSLDTDPGEKCEDEGPGLQSMLLNNFLTECEDKSGKKGLSRRRLRKSLVDNSL